MLHVRMFGYDLSGMNYCGGSRPNLKSETNYQRNLFIEFVRSIRTKQLLNHK